MNKHSVCLILVSLAAIFDVSLCIICFECSEVLSARECTTVTHCGPNEVCINERYINSNGHVYRRLGCRDKNLCPGSVTGRRKRSSPSEELTICERCCDSDFCQTKICDDVDFPRDRGHLCYSCDQQSGGATCDKVKECSRDEVCYESRSSHFSTDTRTTGCMSRSSCHQVMEQFKTLNFTSTNYTETWTDPDGVHRQQVKCFDCCDKDVCNTQCKIPAACKDTQDIGVCRLAQQFICHDKLKASNAGCLKFCGLCT